MKLSASILSADFLHLADELDRVEEVGCDYIHLDVRRLRELDFEIQIDGGITVENAKEKCVLGADTLIAGSMFFNAKDTQAVVKN